MKALFLGTLAASQATPIIEFITADIRTEILEHNEPAQAAAALADADVVLTGAWRSGFPAAPKLRLLQVPLAGTDGIDVSSLPRGVTLCNAYGHEPALGEFAIMMMLAWRHRLLDIATSSREGSWSWSPMVGGAVRGEIGGQDHVLPLACGGPDAVSNMQWQTVAAAKAKDRWEVRACGR